MNDVCVYASPLPFSNKRVEKIVPFGSSLQDIVDGICPDYCDALVSINGWSINQRYWKNVKPKQNTIVNVRVVPQGGRGGGGGKNPLATILSLAVMVAAPALSTAILGSTLSATTIGIGSLTYGNIVAGAIGVVGRLAVSALAPPPRQSSSPTVTGGVNTPTESPTQFIEGARNSISAYGVVPICLGKNRMVPPQAARPYTETQGNSQYVRQLFTWGCGKVSISNIRLGDSPITQFTDYELGHRLNGDLNNPVEPYTRDVFQTDYNVALSYATGYVTRTTAPNASEIIVDVTFLRGLYYVTGEGTFIQNPVSFEVQYSPTGMGSWTTADNFTITGPQQEALRYSSRFTVPTPGTYDVRIRRTNPEILDIYGPQHGSLTAIRSFSFSAPVLMEGVSGTALRIKGTDQLNGIVDQFNADVSLIIPDYDGSGGWVERETSNPASIYRYVLQGPDNANPLNDDQINIADIEEWHSHCEEQGYTYNRVIDFDTSVDETLRDIASAGSASPAIVDGKRTIVVDRIKNNIVQIITPRNSWGYSAEMTYPELPNAFRVQFRNRDKGYIQDERVVYDDGYNESNATKFEVLELPYCTNSDFAFKMARRLLATARLQPETHSFMLATENLVALRGDRIKLIHDVPVVGVGDGRIKTIIGGASPDNVINGSDNVINGTDNVVNGGGAAVTGFTIDDTVNIPSAGTYYVRIRLEDGTFLYEEILTSVGFQNSFTFATPIESGPLPVVGDLCGFILGGGELDLVITKIEPRDDFTAQIAAVNYNEAIFDAENSPIPAWESNVTVPLEFIRPSAPVLIQVQSDEGVMIRNTDGTIIQRAVVTMQNINDNAVSVDVKIRLTGAIGFTSANMLESTPERISITGLDSGLRYDIHVRYRRAGSNIMSQALQINNYLFVGMSGLPSNVENARISIAGETALLSWDRVEDIDLAFYRIKFSNLYSGASWTTAQLLEDAVYENRLSTPFQGGTYLIKAVDLQGNESAAPAVIITYNPGNLLNAVATLTEDPTFAGFKDNVEVDGSNLVMTDTALGTGYYYFYNNLDLGGVFTSFVSASIVANGIAGTGNDIFAEPDIFNMPDVYGYSDEGWDVQLEYRVTNDDSMLSGADWGEWIPFVAGNIEFRAIEFRVLLRSLSTGVTPSISDLSVTVDMPDRIESGEDLTVPVTGATITYDPAFLNNPSVVITLQDAATDDRIEFTSKTASGFTFFVYNETTAGYVERVYDFIASGYGRDNT